MVLIFTVFAAASGESETKTQDTETVSGTGTGSTTSAGDNTALGDYNVKIVSYRLAKDYEGKDVIIIKYNFKNNADKAIAFNIALDDSAYQNGVGLNEAYVLAESAKYSSDNQTKQLQKGSSLDVEAAYELNDKKTDVLVEVKELISLNETKITKTFKIAE